MIAELRERRRSASSPSASGSTWSRSRRRSRRERSDRERYPAPRRRGRPQEPAGGIRPIRHRGDVEGGDRCWPVGWVASRHRSSTGGNRVLVDPRDLAAVAERIDELMAEPQRRRALGAAARSRSRHFLTMDSSPPTYGWSSRSWTGESTRCGGPAADPDRALVTGAFQGRAGDDYARVEEALAEVGRSLRTRGLARQLDRARREASPRCSSCCSPTRAELASTRWVTIGGDDEFFGSRNGFTTVCTAPTATAATSATRRGRSMSGSWPQAWMSWSRNSTPGISSTFMTRRPRGRAARCDRPGARRLALSCGTRPSERAGSAGLGLPAAVRRTGRRVRVLAPSVRMGRPR